MRRRNEVIDTLRIMRDQVSMLFEDVEALILQHEEEMRQEVAAIRGDAVRSCGCACQRIG